MSSRSITELPPTTPASVSAALNMISKKFLKRMVYMTFDDVIALGIRGTLNEKTAEYRSGTKKHHFSLAYRIKRGKIIRSRRSGSPLTVRRLRYILLVIILASLIVLAATACAAILAIGRYSFDVKKEYSRLYIENVSSDKTKIEVYYGLPEEDGWVMDDGYFADDETTVIGYTYNDKFVIFGQSTINEDMGNINTENTSVEPITMYEKNDGFFIDHGGNECYLAWIYDGYYFDICGNITKDEAVELAYSTKIINLEKNM